MVENGDLAPCGDDRGATGVDPGVRRWKALLS